MTKIGIVGCGAISGIYLKSGSVFDILEVTACADLNMTAAEAKAAEHNIRACTVDELMADPEIDIVVNLTIPAAHVQVAMQAVAAGKSTYSEKPFALDTASGQQLLDAAAAQNMRVGCAPDTFLGGGIQTCRKLIDDGAIGEPVAATAFMLSHGHESWHPNPEFYYKPGGGPMFDMGPYYLTALVNLIGPVTRVTGMTRVTFPQRTITSDPKQGQIIDVEVPTHVNGVLEFANGAIGNIITTFDVWPSNLPRIEIYGTEGTMSVPDPNTFGGPVRIKGSGRGAEWQDIELTHSYAENSRGLGVADMAHALKSGRPHRASGELAFHVLEIMQAFHEASDQGRHIELVSTCEQPVGFPRDMAPGILDD